MYWKNRNKMPRKTPIPPAIGPAGFSVPNASSVPWSVEPIPIKDRMRTPMNSAKNIRGTLEIKNFDLKNNKLFNGDCKSNFRRQLTFYNSFLDFGT